MLCLWEKGSPADCFEPTRSSFAFLFPEFLALRLRLPRGDPGQRHGVVGSHGAGGRGVEQAGLFLKWVGEFTTHFSLLSLGVRDFDPWPCS